MRITAFRLLFLSILLVNSYQLTQAVSSHVESITNYKPTFLPVLDQQDRLQIVIRTFNQGKELCALLVNPHTLTTSRANFSILKLRKLNSHKNLPGYFDWEEIENTPYMRLVNHCTSPPYSLQNDGIKHALSPSPINGFFLTVDMCPSANSFEKDFFQKLSKMMPDSAPFEVGISLSGLWMLGNPKEFAWLCEQNNQGKLHITWINHTFRHLYYKDLPLEKNFMLFSPITLSPLAYNSFIETSLHDEVLFTEQLLLEHGQLPSVFFRFPGLVSNEALLQCLGSLGLITLGTNAWLAKGEQPQPGSIILVHGNGNEMPGINKIMDWLNRKEVKWLPLAHLARLLKE